MVPRHPRFSSHADAQEPWRRDRLVRMDGRVREILRNITREPDIETGSLGERIWARHVNSLHDERGVLTVGITHALADSTWLAVIAAVLARAWDGEDETEIRFTSPDGRRIDASRLLAPPPGTEPQLDEETSSPLGSPPQEILTVHGFHLPR
ncbi:hypothetical protein [Muricoccus radiodurans]|uniref:hypothetical protein n=1 Tax=Muricoccus radiodurans TaxID=2231721 RepID=UPI003CFB38A7